MKLTCVGTGGGRFCLTTQQRATGGFMLSHKGTDLYVDPGPGALVRGIDLGINFGSVDGLFISHAHLDHYGDAEAVIEAMTKGCKADRGTLITNDTVLNGMDGEHGVFSSYHQGKIGRVCPVEQGKTCQVNEWDLTITETDHKDIETTGFVATMNSISVGYIPDTRYYDELADQYTDVDYLIANVLRPVNKDWEGHLNLAQAVDLAEEIDPTHAYFQHFGMNFVTSFRKQVSWLDDRDSSVPITLTSDGRTYTIEDQGLEQFV